MCQDLEKDPVDCRIGSLEKTAEKEGASMTVDCRIGSLENAEGFVNPVAVVDCRIGSLESHVAEGFSNFVS